MDNNIFNEIGTTLDLNGPILSYSEQPTGATGIGTTEGATGGGSVSFTGIATGVEPGTGYISYQWYEQDVGKLSDSTYIAGAASTGPVGTAATLTISNLITPLDNQRKFYLVTDYVASAYGTGRSTGNAWNEPLTSGIATVTVTPLIEIVSSPPEGRQALKNQSATISVNADLTDSYFADDLQYQWYLNGEAVSDGTKTVTTTTTGAVAGTVEATFSNPATHILPAVGVTDLEITVAGGRGGGGGYDVGGPGGGGAEARAGRFSLLQPYVTDNLLGQTLSFGVGKAGNGGSSGGNGAYGKGGILDSDDAAADDAVTFTITQTTTGNSANDGSDYIFDNAGCGGSPGQFELYARSGTHKRYVTAGYEGNRICTHFSRGNLSSWYNKLFIGRIRFRNNWRTMDWLKSSNVNIINDSPTLSVTVSRGTFDPNSNNTGQIINHKLNVWYDYQYGTAGSSEVGTISWVYAAPPVVNTDDDGDGGRGGGAGSRGWSGGGGGGGAASYAQDLNGRFIVAGGGGGGGGGSHRAGSAPSGSVGGEFSATTGSVPINDGYSGIGKGGGDGGGGGGGGGGSPGGSGGDKGEDLRRGGQGGQGGYSRYDSTKATLTSQWTSGGSGYVNLKYTGYTSAEVTTVTNTVLSGTTSNTLTISCDTVGVQTCQCKITSATASNSPIWTDVTNFVTTDVVSEYNINVESIGVGQTASLSSINLANGDYEFNVTGTNVASGGITKYYSLYSPDKDIDVEMDLYGGQGDDQGSYTGGEGGYSRIRFTMAQNTEYVIVGLSSDLNAPFLYRKGELIACVGAGGDAGVSGDGGNGGGVSNEGQDGGGREAGIGGVAIAAGTLGANGTFGSQYPSSTVYVGDSQATGQVGGRSIRCTKGVYWAQQGIAACSDMVGNNIFRLPDGTPVSNTKLITRGFKAGYNIMETGGAKDANGGAGGSGVTGGSGGSQGGGGGGSGYNDGSITIVDTQQGGRAADAQVILRVVT